jgi:SNF2 family DNA or RNA helicase
VQELAQPFFLRRTKEEVLDLPPLSEVIIPLSMSPLQKIVYKSVLEKNMDALKAIYDASKAKTKKKVGMVKV